MRPIDRILAGEGLACDIEERMRRQLGLPAQTRARYCVLDEDGNLVPATLMQWARWFEHQPQRIIAQDYFMEERYKVSTVFLGLDHAMWPEGPGQYFETMVFGAPHEEEIFGQLRSIRDDLWSERCETLPQAKAMHERGIRWLEQQDFYV